MEVPLRELAQVIRSKNAGPFELTFDILFDRKSPARATVQARLNDPKMKVEIMVVAAR